MANNGLILGSHVRFGAPTYLVGAIEEALSYGATALMLYTGAPQNTKRVGIEQLHIQEGKDLLQAQGMSLSHVVVHAPYIVNPATSGDEEKEEFAVRFLQQEVERVHAIGAPYLVLHPGAYTNQTVEIGMEALHRHLNALHIPDGLTICIETMAGKGTEIGRTFQQMQQILKGLQDQSHFGVCLDTCHIHDAGYDLRDWAAVKQEFDMFIGLDRVKVMHINDSKNPIGAHKDRHENIGKGYIGFEVLHQIVHDSDFAHVPKILETPYVDGKAPYKEEIAALRGEKG